MARKTDSEGRFLLHIAAESGMGFENGLKRIIEAERRAVAATDPTTMMYPFMMAATGNDGCLDSVYHLLREVLYVVHQCVPAARFPLDEEYLGGEETGGEMIE